MNDIVLKIKELLMQFDGITSISDQTIGDLSSIQYISFIVMLEETYKIEFDDELLIQGQDQTITFFAEKIMAMTTVSPQKEDGISTFARYSNLNKDSLKKS